MSFNIYILEENAEELVRRGEAEPAAERRSLLGLGCLPCGSTWFPDTTEENLCSKCFQDSGSRAGAGPWTR
ncbi:unnamed protein product [Boreogadus saida]